MRASSCFYTLSLHDALPILTQLAIVTLRRLSDISQGVPHEDPSTCSVPLVFISQPRICRASLRKLEGIGKARRAQRDRKSTRLNSSHRCISYAVFCLTKKNI